MDALRNVHHDRARDALCVEGHKGASRRAQRVVGGVAAVRNSIASKAAKAASGERAHATERLVDEQLHCGLPVLDSVNIVTCVVSYIAGARGMVELAQSLNPFPATGE